MQHMEVKNTTAMGGQSHREGSHERRRRRKLSPGKPKYNHYRRHLLMILLVLTFATVASKDFWVSYFNAIMVPRARWGWVIPSQTGSSSSSSIILSDPDTFDWEAASFYNPYESYLVDDLLLHRLPHRQI
jgi:hypothetical protein